MIAPGLHFLALPAPPCAQSDRILLLLLDVEGLRIHEDPLTDVESTELRSLLRRDSRLCRSGKADCYSQGTRVMLRADMNGSCAIGLAAYQAISLPLTIVTGSPSCGIGTNSSTLWGVMPDSPWLSCTQQVSPDPRKGTSAARASSLRRQMRRKGAMRARSVVCRSLDMLRHRSATERARGQFCLCGVSNSRVRLADD